MENDLSGLNSSSLAGELSITADQVAELDSSVEEGLVAGCSTESPYDSEEASGDYCAD